MKCESFDCVGSFDEHECEEEAVYFFAWGDDAIAVCDRHSHIYLGYSTEMSETEFLIARIHQQ